MKNTPEEAKLQRDKHVLEAKYPKGMPDKATATQLLGVDPDNYEKVVNEPAEAERLGHIEDFKDSYESIQEVLEYYMDLPKDQMKLIAIWILGTYIHPSLPSYPFLFINAMRGSGKTRLLKIISHLASEAKGMVLTEPTDSVLFRTPKHHTLIFDEFESIGGKDKSKFRLYLNASYKVGGGVQRSKKVKKDNEETYEIETFEPYKPIAMANIWGMEEVVEDRCLTLILQKSNNPIKTKKIEDFERNKLILDINTKLKCSSVVLCSLCSKNNYIYLWNNFVQLHYALSTYTTYTTLTTLQEEEKKRLEEELLLIPEKTRKLFTKLNDSNIDGRNLELMIPLCLTAELIGVKVFEDILDILVKKIGVKKEDEYTSSPDVGLIDFIANGYDTSKLNFITLKDITNHFKAYLNETYDDDDRWLNTKWVGRALKRLDLVSQKRRVARGMEVMLDVKKAQDKLKMFKKDTPTE